MPLQRSAQRSVGGRGQEQEARQPRQYRGVRRRSWGRYVSEIRLPGKNTRVWLGSYSTPESAARAHDAAAFFLHGDPAALNFPDSASSLPRPKSSSPADIREAASRAADVVPARGGGIGGRVEPSAALPEPAAAAVAAEEQGSGGSWGEWWEAVEDAKEAPLHSPVRMDGAWDGRGFSEFWMEESLLLM
ncbi:hypothetical protein Taro_015900 [Colocasia esculenta]|uniref:AP2/ERF domain-containing protein n=1 Tax=Colocasia esculenta TaxID=4460 RepID=A0A843UCI7_COLES|nr:hypothetical protein [Colocasia esculenta]